MDDGDAAGEATEPTTDRRRLLKFGLLAALLGSVGIGAGYGLLGRDGDAPAVGTPTTEAATTPTPTPDAGYEGLVRRLAPDLFFGRRERWFPTDPRPYASADGDRTVVDGFDALAGYTAEFRDGGAPPRPIVFTNVVPVEGPLVAVQYWFYSVFDQFTVNFHWHDWELLQAFVDVETGAVELLVASAHARSCPNNEYLAPDLGPDGRPVVLAEVGSHSSATDVNSRRTAFERLGFGSVGPDVTNAFVRPLEAAIEAPFAYGLPRDEGARLPYVLPALDGAPLPDHPRLPDVTLDDFVDADVTVRDWGDLARPPSSLPAREAGLVLTSHHSRTAGDHRYDLVDIDEIRRAIDDFVGPQLSFEFAVPGVADDRVASHITSAGLPWGGERFTDPAADITDPAHRRAVRGDSPPGLADRVVGSLAHVLGRPDGAVDALGADEDRTGIEAFVPVSFFPVPVEAACLLLSDPVAVPTAGGVFRFVGVEAGAHDLVVNAPGLAPYAERFGVGGGTIRPGVAGRVAVVANADAVWLRLDRRDSTGIRRVRIVEDVAGAVYDARPVEPDRIAVALHRAGRYTMEVVDRDGVHGAVRVDPRALEGEPIGDVGTGKAAMARTLAGLLEEAAATARELERQTGAETTGAITEGFESAAAEATRAAEAAAQADALGANDALLRAREHLFEVRRALAEPEAAGYTAAGAALVRHRAADGIDLVEAAYATPLAG